MEREKLIETVKAAQNGNETAFEVLFNEAKQNVYYLALKMLNNVDDAQDLTQEVFVTVFKRINTLQNPETFFGWVKQITANKCKDKLCKNDFVLFSGYDDDDNDEPQNEELSDDFLPQDTAEQKEIASAVLNIINNLPEDQKICVLMFYYERLTIQEIAQSLEVSENTVKSRLNYARKKIKTAAEDVERKGFKLHSISVPMLLWALYQNSNSSVGLLPLSSTDIVNAANHIANYQSAANPSNNISNNNSSGPELQTNPQGANPNSYMNNAVNQAGNTVKAAAVQHAASAGLSLVSKIAIGTAIVAGVAGAGYVATSQGVFTHGNDSAYVEQYDSSQGPTSNIGEDLYENEVEALWSSLEGKWQLDNATKPSDEYTEGFVEFSELKKGKGMKTKFYEDFRLVYIGDAKKIERLGENKFCIYIRTSDLIILNVIHGVEKIMPTNLFYILDTSMIESGVIRVEPHFSSFVGYNDDTSYPEDAQAIFESQIGYYYYVDDSSFSTFFKYNNFY